MELPELTERWAKARVSRVSVGWTQVALAGLWGGLVARGAQGVPAGHAVPAPGGRHRHGAAAGRRALAASSVGMLLELFYLGTANLGAALPENDTLAATGTAAARGHAWRRPPARAPRRPSGRSAVLLFIGAGAGGAAGGPAAGGLHRRGWPGWRWRRRRPATSPAPCGRTCGACGRTSSLYGALTAACALLGFFLGPLLERLPLRAAARAGVGLPGHGLGGGGDRGAGQPRAARAPVRGPGRPRRCTRGGGPPPASRSAR